MDLREKLLFIPAIIVEGVRLWVEPPRRFKLKVDHDYEARRERKRREMKERYGELPDKFRVKSGIKPPPLKCIHLVHPYRAYGQDCEAQLTVAIDLNKRRLDWFYTTDWLFGQEHQGSGIIGVAIFSLPFLLPIAPFLILTRRCYEWREKRLGMSRYGHTLLRALRGQLDPETEALLTEALKNTWRHEQAMSRAVTLAEAKTILAGCDLREDDLSAERAARRGDIEFRQFHWFDEQEEYVADGSFYGERDHYVRVLGTTFEDDEADALIGCYRSREVTVLGEDEND